MGCRVGYKSGYPLWTSRFFVYSSVPMARYMAIALAAAVLSIGCASKKAGLDPRGKLYTSSEVQDFLEHTAPPQAEENFVIGCGDRLDIVFFVHKDLSTNDLLVRSDGRITLPYVGDVRAAGLTPMQLDSTLTVRFSEVLRDPNLWVIVREPAQKLVYVLGRVHRPGGFTFETRVSVLQAIALAGGLERGAKTTHVVVIRRDGPERIVGAEINLAAVTSGYNVENDIWLKNFDIVYVPATRLQSASEFVGIVYDILYPPLDVVMRGWSVQVLYQQLDYLRSR